MALVLSGTWEHALLAATAKAASSKNGQGYLGRTALQKIMYFLQILKVPMRYRFELYHYGPFCDRITHDVETLLADNVLVDASTNPERYSNYRPGSETDELLQAHRTQLELCVPSIESVVGALLPFQANHLEILATLDYLYRQLKAGGGTGPWKDRVLARFKEVKKEKHPQSEVEKGYDSLVRASLIEA